MIGVGTVVLSILFIFILYGLTDAPPSQDRTKVALTSYKRRVAFATVADGDSFESLKVLGTLLSLLTLM